MQVPYSLRIRFSSRPSVPDVSMEGVSGLPPLDNTAIITKRTNDIRQMAFAILSVLLADVRMLSGKSPLSIASRRVASWSYKSSQG